MLSSAGMQGSDVCCQRLTALRNGRGAQEAASIAASERCAEQQQAMEALEAAELAQRRADELEAALGAQRAQHEEAAQKVRRLALPA
jgi:hypothetical protein